MPPRRPWAALPPKRIRRPANVLILAVLVLTALCAGSTRGEEGKVQLQVIGGLAGVTQYTGLELPFWQSEIGARSGGRITATIRPLDAGGFRSQEMLQLMRLGVVPFGTALLSIVAGDDPELNAMDLPALNPNMATLQRTLGAFRGHLAEVLRERYNIELLGIYAYPAQVLFCSRPFNGLGDIAGRTVRTSSVGQSELMTALGAVPVLVPFAETAAAFRTGVVECAVTGTLSGYEIGLPGLATHVHDMAISWGISFFGANIDAWNALPADIRDIIRMGVADLERRILAQAEADTARGIACNTGAKACPNREGRPMVLVPASPNDEARRHDLLTTFVLPRWIERCGTTCATAWNTYLAATHALPAEAP